MANNMDSDISQEPWGPYKDCLAEGLEGGCGNRPVNLSLLVPTLSLAIGDEYRVGIGVRASFPVSPSMDLGVSYAYHPIPVNKIFHGHHLDVFVAFPDKFEWGNWRIGAFTDISHFTTLKELERGSKGAGVYTGIDFPLYAFTRELDFNLNIDAGFATPLDHFEIDPFFAGGLEFKWKT